MDLFNTKKVHDLELQNELLKNQIIELKQKIDCYDTALKAFNKYITNEVSNITEYLKTNGRQKSVDGKKVSCFELFLKGKE